MVLVYRRYEMGKVLARVSNEDLISEGNAADLVETDQELNNRQEAFCKLYVSNGFNGTQAYMSAGYSVTDPDVAKVCASQLLSKPNVTRRIATLMAPGLKAQGVTLEKMLGQISAIANFDKRKLYDAAGNRIPVHLLDDETAAALSHFTKDDLVAHDKSKAIDMAMKYLGAYEKDNLQKQENIALQIVLE